MLMHEQLPENAQFSSLIDFFTKLSEIQRASFNDMCVFVRYKESINYQKALFTGSLTQPNCR